MRMDGLGFQVFAGVRREADGRALKQKTSERLTPILLDVTDEARIESAAEAVRAAVGESGLAGLVNNAGISVAAPLEFVPLEDVRRQLEVNVVGQIAVTQAFLSLIRQGHGRIVNVGSSNGRLSVAFLGPYCASKFAMEAVTDSLRQELRPWGIAVSIVQPGSIDTPIWDKGQAAADELEETLPQRAHELYDNAIPAVREAARREAKGSIPADEVAKAVAHALTAKRPKTRYLVGRDAQIQGALALLVPDRVRDWLIVRQLGLPDKA
jgi:NAD(P)-dependent dehydrogenase (short-subunit alcohol dehydrogenase family)